MMKIIFKTRFQKCAEQNLKISHFCKKLINKIKTKSNKALIFYPFIFDQLQYPVNLQVVNDPEQVTTDTIT